MSARCRWCGSREIPWQGLECDRKTQGECGSFGAYQSEICKERAKANKLRNALTKARPFVKSWGELNDENWHEYREAINAVDEALKQ